MTEPGPSEEPRNTIEDAADAAMTAAEAVLVKQGASVRLIYVSVLAGGLPASELDAVTASGGDELPEDLFDRAMEILTFLVGEAIAVGAAVGLTVTVIPMQQGGQG